MSEFSAPREERGTDKPSRSPEKTELRLDQLSEDSRKNSAELKEIADYFKGPDSLWVQIKGIKDAQTRADKDLEEIKTEVKKLTGWKAWIMGGLAVVSLVVLAAFSIWRIVSPPAPAAPSAPQIIYITPTQQTEQPNPSGTTSNLPNQ